MNCSATSLFQHFKKKLWVFFCDWSWLADCPSRKAHRSHQRVCPSTPAFPWRVNHLSCQDSTGVPSIFIEAASIPQHRISCPCCSFMEIQNPKNWYDLDTIQSWFILYHFYQIHFILHYSSRHMFNPNAKALYVFLPNNVARCSRLKPPPRNYPASCRALGLISCLAPRRHPYLGILVLQNTDGDTPAIGKQLSTK